MGLAKNSPLRDKRRFFVNFPITREITKETYTECVGKPKSQVEDKLFTMAEVWGYGVYGFHLYTTEEADGTHYWLKFDRGRSCD